jgi:hypothetical protein
LVFELISSSFIEGKSRKQAFPFFSYVDADSLVDYFCLEVTSNVCGLLIRKFYKLIHFLLVILLEFFVPKYDLDFLPLLAEFYGIDDDMVQNALVDFKVSEYFLWSVADLVLYDNLQPFFFDADLKALQIFDEEVFKRGLFDRCGIQLQTFSSYLVVIELGLSHQVHLTRRAPNCIKFLTHALVAR